MEANQFPLVSIWCLVYNHEPYLRQCLDGFVMQKTNFKFEAIVHDDVSTDGSAAIIREYAEKYPEIIKPIFETENQYSKRDGSLDRIMYEACKGKYIALCEGDDYWTDPLKLQKQVDFLKNNPEYALCHTGFEYLNSSLKIDHTQLNLNIISNQQNIIAEILDHNNYRIQTCTVLIRTDSYNNIRDNLYKIPKFMMGDTPLWILLLSIGKIHFIPETTAIYRIVPGSASHQKDIQKMLEFNISAAEMRLYFSQELNLPQKYIIKFQEEYFYNITRYIWINSSYQPNSKIKIKSIFSKIKFCIFTHTPIRQICRYIYLKRYKKYISSTSC